MASTPLKAGEKDRSIPRAYSELSLERRLLVTPDTTINIASISRVVVTGTTVAGQKQTTPLAKLLIFGAPPLLTMAGLISGSAIVLSLLVLMSIGAATAGYLAPKEVIREEEKTHMLAVYTIDGGELRFMTSNLTILNNARTLIANRMTEQGEGLPIKIDFAKGLITTTAEAVKQQAETAAQKANGSTAPVDDDIPDTFEEPPRSNGKSNGARNYASIYDEDDEKVWAKEPPRQLNLTLDPHLGEREPAKREKKEKKEIDYGDLVPAIEQWHRTAANSHGWEEAADLLHELERLAKSGTPSGDQRARIRTLAIELSTILNAYPPATQLMKAIMRQSSA